MLLLLLLFWRIAKGDLPLENGIIVLYVNR
jgi:hypothetical protein